MNPNIRIHIDQIVLDGVDIPPSQRDRLKAAVSAELSRLWSEYLTSGQALPAQLQVNSAIATVSVNVPSNARPNSIQVGHQIAQSVHAQLLESAPGSPSGGWSAE